MKYALFCRFKNTVAVAGLVIAIAAVAQEAAPPAAQTNATPGGAWWNFHMANTEVGQFHPGLDPRLGCERKRQKENQAFQMHISKYFSYHTATGSNCVLY